MKRAEWIAPKKFGTGNEIYYFKKTVTCKREGKAICKISAQSRYKLYVNGELCGFGPCKGTREKMFVDTLDVTKYMKKGENEILVEVLKLSSPSVDGRWGAVEGVLRKGMAALCFELHAGGTGVRSSDTWRCAKKTGTELRPINSAAFTEKVEYPACEKLVFKPVISLGNADDESTDHYWWGITSELFLHKRPIPNLTMEKKDISFDGEYFDASYLTFGFPRFTVKGKGTAHIYYFECFGSQDPKIKADRCDRSLGFEKTTEDVITVDGECTFEPFWFRTFRFIRVETEGDVSVKLDRFFEVNYPMEVRDDYDFDREDDNKLFEISVRTLKRCMHETYEDCPYYEQLQYAMDTSLQMIFNYQLTDDDCLARKAMDDFAACQHADGLMVSRYPCIADQHIPTFQLYFIFMVYSHYIRFGDVTLVRKHLRAVDGVIEWFSHLVTDKSIVGQSKYWNFIDWAEPWTYDEKRKCDGGVPLGYKEGPIGIYSSMLAYFLKIAAKLNTVCKRRDVANEYETLAAKISKGTEKYFYDEKAGMYADDLAHTKYSQHMQTWCVLSGIAEGERAGQIMKNSLDVSAKSTYAFAYMYFRALEKVGMYGETERMMQSYRNLLKLNCTTVPETPVASRSECHAWGAVAIYEFSATVLGVRTDDPAKKSVTVKPYINGRDFAKGTVSSICGDVFVSWKKSDGVFEITVKNESDREKTVVMPNGEVYKSDEKEIRLSCKI